MLTEYDITQEKIQTGRRKRIMDNRTKRGGWTKDFLASIGVSWPPQRGWKQWYIEHGNMEGFEPVKITDDDNNCT